MVNAYLMFSKTNPKSAAIILNAMESLITSANSNLNPQSISKLFTLNDIGILDFMNLGKFQPCFKSIIESHGLNEVLSSFFEHKASLEDLTGSAILSYKSPCKNITNYPECTQFCLWHEEMFSNKLWTDELLELMR